MHDRTRALLAGALLLFPARALAQGSSEPTQQDSVDELKQRIELLERDHDEEVGELYDEIEGLHQDLATLAARGRETTQHANALNPAITAFGNFLGRIDDVPVHLDDNPAEARIDDQLSLREVELDVRAAVDPWAEGVIIASLEAETPGDFTSGIEEGYVVLKQLPYLDAAPAGLKLEVGRFRPAFGRLNQVHLHDLPQPSYPRALGAFLGPEGYVEDGVSGRFFLPSPTDSQTIEASLAVLDGGGLPLAESQRRSDVAFLGRVNWFGQLCDDSNLELGASGWQSDADHRLYGADATYKWKPRESGEWRSWLLGGEVFHADLNEAGLDNGATGYYLWTQLQLDRNAYVGVRYDRAPELADASLATDTYGAYLTYYTTEFLRMRLGYEHAESDVGLLDGRDTLLFELNFVIGSHPVEPYWVNH